MKDASIAGSTVGVAVSPVASEDLGVSTGEDTSGVSSSWRSSSLLSSSVTGKVVLA